MIGMLIAAAGTALILLLGEYFWRKHILAGEFARKFIHISAATFAAFWPFFVPRLYIAILSIVFVVALVIIKKLGLFKSLHSVQRATYGEIWYAVSIGALALIFKSDAIFMVAVLHMALADGFAAVIGVGLNHKAKRFIFNGFTKSIAGSLTFVVISFVLNFAYWSAISQTSLVPINISPILYSALSAIALALVEITAPKGSDNVLVPGVSGFLLWLPTLLA